MTHYRIHEADLVIGPDWQDQSLQVFKLPAPPGGKEASFVVSRDLTRGAAKDFDAYIIEQRAKLKDKLPGFKLIKDQDIHHYQHDGAWFEYTWRNGASELFIRQVFYDRNPQVLIFTLTCSPTDAAHFDLAWRSTMHGTVLQPLPSAPAQEAPPPFPPPESIVNKGAP